MTPSSTDLFSREALAGYDRGILDRAVVALIGAGAGANNEAANLALVGVHELRVVDFDTIEPSNVTRSILFRRDLLGSTRPRYKARELAHGALALSYAPAPVVRYAVARVEDLGLGALLGADVIISAVDSFAVRAYLADACRLLGIPLVEGGFSGHEGHATVFPNRTAEEACFRCLHPSATYGHYSCATYAARVLAEGRVPATQPLAGVFGALMTEAAIQALHDNFPLGGKLLTLDIQSGASRLLTVTPSRRCRGVHRRHAEIVPVAVRANEPVEKLLALARDRIAEPALRFLLPFLVDAPCARCGTTVAVGRSGWAVREPPVCTPNCPATPRPAQGSLLVETIALGDPLASRSCQSFGLRPGAVVEVVGRDTDEVLAVQLEGNAEDLFITKRREARHARSSERMNEGDAAEAATTTESAS